MDAFNLPLQIVPLARPKCDTLTCAQDFLSMCPAVGQYKDSSGKLVACVDPDRNNADGPVAQYFEACDDAKNAAEQQAFLEDAVAYLEAEPRIERYAWFSGRASNVPYVDLLGASGQLTALGQAYVNAPRNEACTR